MAEANRIDFNDSTSILNEEDEQTLAAIDRGSKAADEGCVVTLEEARERMKLWFTKSSSPKTR
jgi:predicted transcriptional regulator